MKVTWTCLTCSTVNPFNQLNCARCRGPRPSKAELQEHFLDLQQQQTQKQPAVQAIAPTKTLECPCGFANGGADLCCNACGKSLDSAARPIETTDELWTCVGCTLLNSPKRLVCSLCSTPRPPSSLSLPSQSTQIDENKMSLPLVQVHISEPLPLTPASPAINPFASSSPWVCSGCGTSNLFDQYLCTKCAGARSSDFTPLMLPSSEAWVCVGCTLLNSPKHLVCPLCATPRLSSSSQAATQLDGNQTSPPSEGLPIPKESTSPPASASILSLPSSGSWVCDGCGISNSPEHSMCTKCATPRPPDLEPPLRSKATEPGLVTSVAPSSVPLPSLSAPPHVTPSILSLESALSPSLSSCSSCLTTDSSSASTFLSASSTTSPNDSLSLPLQSTSSVSTSAETHMSTTSCIVSVDTSGAMSSSTSSVCVSSTAESKTPSQSPFPLPSDSSYPSLYDTARSFMPFVETLPALASMLPSPITVLSQITAPATTPPPQMTPSHFSSDYPSPDTIKNLVNATSDSTVPSTHWTCGVCTLVNENDALKCQVCEALRDQASSFSVNPNSPPSQSTDEGDGSVRFHSVSQPQSQPQLFPGADAYNKASFRSRPLRQGYAFQGEDQVTKALVRLSVADRLAWQGFRVGSPVIILPGLLSSCLVVKESALVPKWQGQRVWLDLWNLGLTDAQRNRWTEHMVLGPDGASDRVVPGGKISVRPVVTNNGLDGVEWLTEGPFSSRSYVFGPMIKELRQFGYSGQTLVCQPYDWRLAPSALQQRDQFIDQLLSSVTELYAINNKPVTILGHSMGCKIAHYFMRYCLEVKGQAWIDKYIDRVVAISAPWSGAPKSLRSILVGDNTGSRAILGVQQALVFGRNYSSVPWLLPLHPRIASSAACPLAARSLEHFGYARKEDWVVVWVKGAQLVPRSKGEADTYFLQLKMGSTLLSTSCQPTPTPVWNSRFQFAFPSALGTSPLLTLTLRRNSAGWPASWCAVLAEKTFGLPELGIRAPANETIATTVTLAEGFSVSLSIRWSSLASRLNTPAHELMGFSNTVFPPVRLDFCGLKDPDPKAAVSYRGVDVEGMLMLDTTAQAYRNWQHHYSRDPLVEPSLPLPCRQLLHIYGTGLDTEIGSVFRRKAFHTEQFDDNEKGKRVAEENGVARSASPDRPVGPTWKIESDLELDQEATSSSLGLLPSKHLKVAGGVIFETFLTPQLPDSADTTKVGSGDGTVPYESLTLCKQWASEEEKRSVQVLELPGAEHRGILADPRCHEAVFRAVCAPPALAFNLVIENITLRLKPDTQASSSWRPVCEIEHRSRKFCTGYPVLPNSSSPATGPPQPRSLSASPASSPPRSPALTSFSPSIDIPVAQVAGGKVVFLPSAARFEFTYPGSNQFGPRTQFNFVLRLTPSAAKKPNRTSGACAVCGVGSCPNCCWHGSLFRYQLEAREAEGEFVLSPPLLLAHRQSRILSATLGLVYAVR